MDSLYGLTYIPVNMDNLELAFKIQKEIWTSDPDYKGLLNKAKNRADNNCSFLVYHDNTLIGITGVDFYKEYEDTILTGLLFYQNFVEKVMVRKYY